MRNNVLQNRRLAVDCFSNRQALKGKKSWKHFSRVSFSTLSWLRKIFHIFSVYDFLCSIFYVFVLFEWHFAGLMRLKAMFTYHVFSPTAESTVAGESSLAMAPTPGHCTDVSYFLLHLVSRLQCFFEFPSPSTLLSYIWNLFFVTLRQSYLLMKALICQMDERSRTCILALETVENKKIIGARRFVSENKRKEKWFCNKNQAKMFLFFGKSHVFYYQTVIFSFLVLCLLVSC